MRYLTIVRHCKAIAHGLGVTDFERTLSARGQRQCEQLRRWALDTDALGSYGPSVALVSGAVRTRETFERAFLGTAFVREHHFSDRIYNGTRDVGAHEIVNELDAIDDGSSSLLVVAHNPSVYEFVMTLAIAVPPTVVRDGYPLGGAFVLALEDHEHVGLAKYELVASFVPD